MLVKIQIYCKCTLIPSPAVIHESVRPKPSDITQYVIFLPCLVHYESFLLFMLSPKQRAFLQMLKLK